MINKLNCINIYNPRIQQNKKNISFGEGKVEVFSDFDKTYYPLKQSELEKMNRKGNPWFGEYCTKFKTFFDNTKEGLKFHITTGRTFGEYESAAEQIKDNGYKLPLPDTFIAKNGSDEYLKIGTDEDFYQKGIFPFCYDITNIEKEKNIKELTGWDGAKIKAKLKELLTKHEFRTVEGDSERSVSEYGKKSLFANGKLPDEADKPFWENDKPDWIAGLRNDGNCKIFITYPQDMEETPERAEILDKINDEMAKFRENIGATEIYEYSSKPDKKRCGGRLRVTLEPMVDKTLKNKVERNDLKGLTKLYDTKEAVKKAKENNDLVIVAGDGANDFTMLNPLLYIDIPENMSSYCANPSELIKKAKEDKQCYKDIAKQINDLPLMGIVIKTEKKPLDNIAKTFGTDSEFNKIIEVKKGHLENGIKEAIKIYAKQHPEYAEKLSPDLRKEIFTTT